MSRQMNRECDHEAGPTLDSTSTMSCHITCQCRPSQKRGENALHDSPVSSVGGTWRYFVNKNFVFYQKNAFICFHVCHL